MFVSQSNAFRISQTAYDLIAAPSTSDAYQMAVHGFIKFDELPPKVPADCGDVVDQEAEQVMDTFNNHLHLPVTKVDDSERVLAALKVTPH